MSLTLRITGFKTLHSLLSTNQKLYNSYCEPSTCTQNIGEDGTRYLLLFWDDNNAWHLTVESVVAATGIPADRIVITNTEDLQQLYDAHEPVAYIITTKSYNMEDVLHKLFTQLYNDDLFFGLDINHHYPEVTITFSTLHSKARVQEVLGDYGI